MTASMPDHTAILAAASLEPMPPLPNALPGPPADGSYRICLVCLGNICRSPTAEVVLRAELDRAGARAAVTAVHTAFGPLNRRFSTACTDWQIRPTRVDPMAFNDHSDWSWDERVLRTLSSTGHMFRLLCDELAAALARFHGYADRYFAALAHVDAGRRAWIDAYDRDSCHLVWIQFHEDLLATLNLPRGSEASE